MIELNSATEHDAFINKNDKCVIFFGSKNCPPCRESMPVMEELARKYPRIKFSHVEVTKTKMNDLTGTPTFVGYKNQVPIDVITGADFDGLEGMVSKLS